MKNIQNYTKPSLFVLVGLSGSGKSTYAKELAFTDKEREHIVVSSDAIRSELYGSEECQDNHAKVFAIVHERVINGLKAGYNVIADATNLSIKDRSYLLEKVKDIDCWKVAVVIATPFNICIQQDSQRERKVSREVIERQIRKFEIPFKEEGFDEIQIINPTQSYENLQELVDKTIGYNQNNHWHKYTLDEHMIKVASQIMDNCDEFYLFKAALYHDICKPQSQITKPNGEYGFYNHSNMGCYYLMCTNECSKWFFEPQEYLDFLFIVCYHMKALEMKKSETLEKYKKLFGEEKFNNLMLFAKCDRIGSGVE